MIRTHAILSGICQFDTCGVSLCRDKMIPSCKKCIPRTLKQYCGRKKGDVCEVAYDEKLVYL